MGYYLNHDLLFASAFIPEHEPEEGEIYPTEIVIPNKITYNGVTYSVDFFDLSFDNEGAMEYVTFRGPLPVQKNYHRRNLRKVTVEAGIFSLNMGFSHYTALEEVVFEDPKDMERAGLYFYDCPKLKDIYIPADVDILPRVRQCPNADIIFAPDHPKYMVVDGDIYSKDGKILYDVPKGKKNYKVKKSVKEIGVYAFYGNGDIRHIRVPSSVKKIAAYAFGNMENLKSVKLSKNLKIAEDHLLARSTKLKTITYPKKIRIIQGSFGRKYGCRLKKMYIKAEKLKKIKVNGLPKTCTIYVKNQLVKKQVRDAGFNGKIIVDP